MADTFRILIATDNHLGYKEKDPIRGRDSFRTFDEILGIAASHGVDLILLGGDLFHDNKPSRKCLHKTIEKLRQYCLGDAPSNLEFLSDQSQNFPDAFSTVNFLDPNYNVKIPVFSIHGNHDDPSGDGNLCALDILSVSGLINYFGKQNEVDNISIKPILLKKGTSRLALYGLGNIRDERLNRTFRNKKVEMFKPTEFEDEWFNLMVLHQNRAAHSSHNFISEDYLDNFLHLVLWGHEHECLIRPQQKSEETFFVTQPGSSVATSLCEGESRDKYVGILEVTGHQFSINEIRLKTVRPFIMQEVELKLVEDLDPTDQTAVSSFLQQKIKEMIADAKAQWRNNNASADESDFPKPLIRLKVEYSGGFTTFNPQRFGQQYVDSIANPKEIILFYRRRTITPKEKLNNEIMDIEPYIPEKLDDFKVEDLVTEFLSHQKLSILPENEMAEIVKTFVTKQETQAISDFVWSRLDATQCIMEDPNLDFDSENVIEDEVAKVKTEREELFATLNPAKVEDSRLVPRASKNIMKDKGKKRLSSKVESEHDDNSISGGFEDDSYRGSESSSKARKTTKATVTRVTKKSKLVKEIESDLSETEIVSKPAKGRPKIAQSACFAKNALFESKFPKVDFQSNLAAPFTVADSKGNSRNFIGLNDEEDDDVVAIDTVRKQLDSNKGSKAIKFRQSTLDFSASQKDSQKNDSHSRKSELTSFSSSLQRRKK